MFFHLDCRGSSTSNLPWIIAVAIVGGILLLGLLALIIAKIILVIIVSDECTRMCVAANQSSLVFRQGVQTHGCLCMHVTMYDVPVCMCTCTNLCVCLMVINAPNTIYMYMYVSDMSFLTHRIERITRSPLSK